MGMSRLRLRCLRLSSYPRVFAGRLGLRTSGSGSFSDSLCWPLCCSEVQTSRP